MGRIGSGNRRPVQVVKVKEGGWTKGKRQIFLDTLAATCNVTHATAAAGMKGKSAYDLRRADPVFAELWREALATGYERLEDAVLRQALMGVNALEIDPEAGVALPSPSPVPDETVEETSRTNTEKGGHARPGSGISRGLAMPQQVHIALAVLNRYRASVEGRGSAGRGPRRATAEETDAAIHRKLDALLRQVETGL